ncbi:MAG: N-acetylmuramoyl-L-alanine amidase [Muribaculaceae bacterium]|nr:N-acetylmuramoyl-L-alanine amidase [Muribaculaceae bacterium]
MKHLITLIACIAALTCAAQPGIIDHTTSQDSNELTHYITVDSVKHIIVTQYTGGTSCNVRMYVKTSRNDQPAWRLALTCDGIVGRNGMGKTRQGDKKTPLGDFGIITAFGIKPDPGTTLPYVDVTDDIYCCADPVAYNRIINIRDKKHQCRGEHMIKFDPDYNYGFFFDYNKECKQGKGAAVFFHCTSDSPATAGCIGVAEQDMVTILRTIDINARLIIKDKETAPAQAPAATAATGTLKMTDITSQINFGHQEKRPVTIIVVHSNHYVGADPYSTQGCISQFRQYNVAPHYMIERNGNILKMVDEDKIAYHAGESRLPGTNEVSLNQNSIGIEIINTTTEPPTQAQIDALVALVADIRTRHNIKHLMRHSDIAPKRKTDPWCMDWPAFCKRVVSTSGPLNYLPK